MAFPIVHANKIRTLSLDAFKEMDYYAVNNYHLPVELMMESAGIPLNWIKRYQGRKVSDSTGPYSNPQDIPDKLIQTYIQGYDSLRLYTETREFEAVKQELSQYKMESDQQRLSNNGKVNELEAQIAQLSAALTKVMDKLEKHES